MDQEEETPFVIDETSAPIYTNIHDSPATAALRTVSHPPNTSQLLPAEASPNFVSMSQVVVNDNFYGPSTGATNSANKSINISSHSNSSSNSNSNSSSNIRAPNPLPKNSLGYDNIRSTPRAAPITAEGTVFIEKSSSLEFGEESFISIDETDGFTDPLTTRRNPSSQQPNSNLNPTKPYDWLSYSFQNGKTSSEVDVLSLLLSDDSKLKVLGSHCQYASQTAQEAATCLAKGDISQAVGLHVSAAKLFKECAIQIKGSAFGTTMPLLSYSLLVLSHAQARNASLLLKHGRLDLCPLPKTSLRRDATIPPPTGIVKKIRDSINGQTEDDMTESIFLGDDAKSFKRAVQQPVAASATTMPKVHKGDKETSLLQLQQTQASNKAINPLDDMMELEKELRDMNMTLEMGVGLGSSVASIGAGKKSLGGESFLVVPPENNGGSSYMSSSIMWASGVGKQHGRGRVQRGVSIPNPPSKQHIAQPGTIIRPGIKGGGGGPIITPGVKGNGGGGPVITSGGVADLNSSWWGQASALASSTTSISNSMVGIRPPSSSQTTSSPIDPTSAPANTKQLVKLLDSLKAIGDENAVLMRELENAETARKQAKAADDAMERFREDYNKRFLKLKAALEKFRKEYPDKRDANAATNLFSNSEHLKSAMNAELQKRNAELQRRDKVIKKLQADLIQAKADLKDSNEKSAKKDIALSKYEKFYKEVKMRSAARQAQREQEQKARKPKR